MKFTKKKRNILLVIVGILILLHIALPFILTRYVNKTLKDIPEYTGSVNWIHVNLFRGAYQIHTLEILKETEDLPEPFFKAKNIDLSIEWGAIFDGEIVGEIILIEPELVFIPPPTSDSEGQTGTEVDWTKPIKDLMPISINRFEIQNGTVHYKDISTDPLVDVYTSEIDVLVTNLSNAEASSDDLPADLKVTAITIGGGYLNVDGHLNILQQTPSFDLDISLENVSLPTLNDFFKAYANLDLAEGTLDFYSEFGGIDGDLNGYVKPLFKDLNFVTWESDKDKPLQMIWESFVGLTVEIFENQGEDQFATKVPLEGKYDDPNTNGFVVVLNILKNAFIEAFSSKTDNTINLKE